MKEVPQIEAIKYALRQSKDGTVVSFVIHPEDLDPALQCLPIGARVMLGWYQIGDDEKPVASGPTLTVANTHGVSADSSGPPQVQKPKRERSLAEHVAWICKDVRFWNFIGVASEEEAARTVRGKCNVTTRGDIKEGTTAAAAWERIEARYNTWMTDELYGEVAR